MSTTAVSNATRRVRNERMEASGIESFEGFSLAEAETPEFVGQVITALANDPEVNARSGHTLITAETAVDGWANADFWIDWLFHGKRALNGSAGRNVANPDVLSANF